MTTTTPHFVFFMFSIYKISFIEHATRALWMIHKEHLIFFRRKYVPERANSATLHSSIHNSSDASAKRQRKRDGKMRRNSAKPEKIVSHSKREINDQPNLCADVGRCDTTMKWKLSRCKFTHNDDVGCEYRRRNVILMSGRRNEMSQNVIELNDRRQLA